MFTIRFATTQYRPDAQVTIRSSAQEWKGDIAGLYDADQWIFQLDEGEYPAGIEFKFVLERTYWMLGPNIVVANVSNGGTYSFAEGDVQFPAITEVVVENSRFQQLFFQP